MNNKIPIIAVFAVLTAYNATAWPEPVVRVVHEPWQVSSCSSKSEHAWAHCTWCNCKISYERTYRWNVYNREWIESTTKVPELCRKCQVKQKEREKLAREEANLDRKIEERETKARIAKKRELLRKWSSVN